MDNYCWKCGTPPHAKCGSGPQVQVVRVAAGDVSAMSATANGKMIAGHTFISGICACGKRWEWVKQAVPADIGTAGWSHAGLLSEREYQEIRAEDEREKEACWKAIGEISGRSRSVGG